MNTPDIETERLLLRRFTENDLKALLLIYGDEEVNTYLPWFPVKSWKEAKALFEERYKRFYAEPKGYRYGICLKEDNVPIGYIHVAMDDSYDFGYGLRKEFWHRGIVTEGSRAVIGQLKRDGIPYITATHDVKNIASGNVMKRLGMHYQYSYEEQWQPKDILVTFRMYQLNLNEEQNVFRKYWEESKVHFVDSQ